MQNDNEIIRVAPYFFLVCTIWSMETSIPASQSATVSTTPALGLLYHCVCGQEFQVDANTGGTCPGCLRRVRAEAIQTAMSATVSITNINNPEELHHFEVDPDDSLANRVFGHFRLDRKLGVGGMGSVYRALDMSLERYVAVKVMRQTNHCLDARVAAMLREAVAQARLNHPNVVTIYYVGRQDEEPFLAMELLPGPTLYERLTSSGAIPYAEAIRYSIQIASALKHASQFDIVHADIKPANLIMAGDGRIKLSDFGLSRIKDASVENKSISGTPAYVAPELVSGEGFSIQSDMYALGVTLFELVFGRLPFQLVGKTVRERLDTHLTAEVDYPASWPNEIPREFKQVIDRLLAKDPSQRYSDYDLLIKDLVAIEPVSTTTAGMALRAMAYALDQVVLLLCISPFAAAITYIQSYDTSKYTDYLWLTPVLAFVSLIVPAVYLVLVYRGWRSIGRILFQLRIVEQNGLPPRREQLVSREVLRNAFAWFWPLAIYVEIYNLTLSRSMEVGLVIFLCIDAATTFLLKGRKAFHDYLCHSRVVLAVDTKK